MQTMLALTLLAIALGVALAVVRASRGPTSFDRVLAVNTIGTMAVLAICVYGFLDGRPEFLDIAMVYALINFIATIAVTKYIKFSRLGRSADVDEVEDI